MLFDTHLHYGTNPLFNLPEEDLINMIKKYHIDIALVSNVNGAELDHKQNFIPMEFQKPQIEVLKESIAMAKKYKNVYIAPWIKPYTETCDKEFIQLVEENLDIIKALKIHPYHSNVSLSDARMEPYYKLAEKHHLTIVSHTGGCDAARSIHTVTAAKKHPSINFVMVHMDLGTDNEEALKCLGMADNIYGDTTWVPITTTIKAIKLYGSKKMIFGSDGPIDGVDTYKYNKSKERSIYQDYFELLPKMISKDEYDDLMFKNAIKIFNIKLEDNK